MLFDKWQQQFMDSKDGQLIDDKRSCPTCFYVISPEQVLCSGSHAHLLVDLLVDASPPVLQFAALCLGKRVTSLQRVRRLKWSCSSSYSQREMAAWLLSDDVKHDAFKISILFFAVLLRLTLHVSNKIQRYCIDTDTEMILKMFHF